MRWRAHLLALGLFGVVIARAPSAEADWVCGTPSELAGPTADHAVTPIGREQPVLVLFVQAADFPILPASVAASNTTEDAELDAVNLWFDTASWQRTSFRFTKQRQADGRWYTLPKGLLEYARVADVPPLEARDASLATSTNPTPPSSLAVSAGAPAAGDPPSTFTASLAGEYFYAVSAFRNGSESRLTRLSSSVAISEGQLARVTLTPPGAADADRFIIYRTGRGQADALANYDRIGYAAPGTSSISFIDPGITFDASQRHIRHCTLLEDAMTAVGADVADFEAYSGIIANLHVPTPVRESAATVAPPMSFRGRAFRMQSIAGASSGQVGALTHELGHWLGLPDQYMEHRYDPLESRIHLWWTTMSGSNDRIYAAWEKAHRLGWIERPTHVKSFVRPAAGEPAIDETVQLVATGVADEHAETHTAAQVRVADGVHYYVETRRPILAPAGGYDIADHDAGDGKVVVMEAVDAWPPGIYPYRTLPQQWVLGTTSTPLAIDPGVTITATGVNDGPPRSVRVRIQVAAAPRPDPSIRPWTPPPWDSPDVWIDSEREGGGWDDPTSAMPRPDNGEAAWVNHVNRVYARITNLGEGNAEAVRVRFRVNTPGGVGDAGQFVELTSPAPVDLPAGAARNVFAEWTPSVGQHTCIQVEIGHVTGEASIHNNNAQENVTRFYTGSSSPWHDITIPVRIANPFEEPKTIALDVHGLPANWRARLENPSVTLAAKALKTVHVTITPDPAAPRCTRAVLNIRGITRVLGHIDVYGGITPIVHLANPVAFEKLVLNPVQSKTNPDPKGAAAFADDVTSLGRVFRFAGKMLPPIKDAQIAIVVTDPSGKDRVTFTRTDAEGAFTGVFTALMPGAWAAYAYYQGDDCNAPTESKKLWLDFGSPRSGWPAWCCALGLLLLTAILIAVVLLLRQRRSSAP